MIATRIASPAGWISLRPATAPDQDFRFQLFCASRKLAGQLSHLDRQFAASIMLGQFRAQMAAIEAARPRAESLVAELAGGPIGAIALDREDGGIHLVDMSIAPAWRGQGIGTALLRAVMQAAETMGQSVSLTVATDNPDAQRLYARLGFLVTSADDAYLRMRWQAEPAPR